MRVALLGSGLIGGSIGLALRRLDSVAEVVVYDRSEEAARRAVERGAADRHEATPAEAVREADVIFVATPVGAIANTIKAAIPGLKSGAILTDVGSTKSRVVDEVTSILGANVTFLGGHPMAGSEEDGIEGAKEGLFDGAWWILTPTPRVEPAAYRTLHGLLSGMGCHVIALEPALHDELMAIISHLPHLTAATLMNMAADHGKDKASLLSLAAGGFRDVTRVAASNPGIWIDICRENADAIVRALGEFIDRLSELRDFVARGATDDLQRRLESARLARRALAGKRTDGELFEVFIPIPDRPGVLAEVTTLIGNAGVNIEDIQISHAEEGGRGVLRILILGEDESTKVHSALSSKGYQPRSTSI
ncbi:MAG TPA: prephenate dehydrogenase [Actinomycetota bacterium]|nr:prephenate dehydrogenase [Actinomycetota bacterium]